MPEALRSMIMERAAAAAVVRPLFDRFQPTVAIVLGSGMGALPTQLQDAEAIDYATIPYFPVSQVPGHANQLWFGRLFNQSVMVFSGRVHGYEGFSAQRIGFAIQLVHQLGLRDVWLTNASGAITPTLNVGEVVLVRDHINWPQISPLVGPVFVDMQDAYSKAWRQRCQDAARNAGLPALEEVVYATCCGPNYETPSEIELLRRAGVDIVGMSTVVEVIQAVALGLQTLVFSIVTNQAAGLSPTPLSHEEITAHAQKSYRTILQLWEQLLVHLQRP